MSCMLAVASPWHHILINCDVNYGSCNPADPCQHIQQSIKALGDASAGGIVWWLVNEVGVAS